MGAEAGDNLERPAAEQTPLTGDQYVALLQQRRDDAWDGNGWPPLLEWFIHPGDERLFTPPAAAPQSSSTPPRRPRRRVTLEELTRRRDALVAQRDDAAAPLVSDSAAIRGVALGRRRTRALQTKNDQRLTRYAMLDQRVRVLDSRIARHPDAARKVVSASRVSGGNDA